jgi:hypothetical protein
MIRKLWSNDPPLPEDEIASRIASFDVAVERIEGDFDTPEPGTAATATAAVHLPAVYEGYDEAADYTPASGGRAVSRSRETETEEPSASHRELEPVAAPAPPPAGQAARWQRSEPEPEDVVEQESSSAEDTDPLPSLFSRTEKTPEPAEEKLWRDDAAGFEEQDEFDDFHRAEEPKPRPPRSERDLVRILAAVIACLAVFLVGFGIYVFYPRSSGPAVAENGAVKQMVISDAATAAEIPKRAVDVVKSFDVFDGRDPQVFVGSPDNPIRFDKDKDGGFTRVSSTAEAAGARAVIGPGLAVRLAGQTIRITLTARSSREGGADKLRFAYQSGVAISHWQVANVSQAYGEIGLIWRVPTQRTSNGDALIIEPGIPGDGTGVDIKAIRIDLIKQG